MKIFNDTIECMLTIQVWGYIDQYWTKLPTFPDPVTKIHYTTTKLVNVIYRQMNDDSHQLVYHVNLHGYILYVKIILTLL